MKGKAGRFSRFKLDVSTIGGLTGWWDASDSTTLFNNDSGGSTPAADGAVGRLEDKSGNGRNFTQISSSNRPTRKTSEQNGLDVLRFNGTSNRMVSSATFQNVFSATASTAFVVAKAAAVGTDFSTPLSNASILSEFNGAHMFVMLRSNNTAAAVGYDSAYRTASVAYEPGNWKAFSELHDGADLKFFVSGSSSSQTSMSTRTFLTGSLRLGSNNSQTVFFSGDVGELITFNVALSASVREAVEAYLVEKWGLT